MKEAKAVDEVVAVSLGPQQAQVGVHVRCFAALVSAVEPDL